MLNHISHMDQRPFPASATTPELRADILRQFRLPHHSVHGPAHWSRVRYNGLLLSRSCNADWQVVELFAFIHDSQRYDDGYDPDHGPRAADYALRSCGKLFQLSEPQLQKLMQACMGHTHERLASCVTVQTCWDADRLDLARVGIIPDPFYLGTALAKHPQMIADAIARSRGQSVKTRDLIGSKDDYTE
jgi:uncharacterized protein